MSRRNRNKTPQRSVIKSVSEIKGSPGATQLLPYNEPSSSYTKEVERIIIPHGSDNLFPQSVSYLLRKSGYQNGIIDSQTVYLAGQKITFEDKALDELVHECNSEESLHELSTKFFKDYTSFGNGWIQVLTDANRTYFSLYHQDSTEARIGRGDYEGYCVLHPNWADYLKEKNRLKTVKMWPEIEETEEAGVYASMIHVKDYEPEFKYYGVPNWLSGLDAVSIGYKANRWNISRLDKSPKPGGMLITDAEFESEELEQDFREKVNKNYQGEGTTGEMLFIKRSLGEGGKDGTQFIQFNDTTDADWIELKESSIQEMLVASNWAATLAGIETASGFDTSRILNEYNVKFSSFIAPRQQVFLNTISKIGRKFGIDTSTLEFVNRPPVPDEPDVLLVWESRKMRGLDFDENDPRQQMTLAELKSNQKFKDETTTIQKIKNLFNSKK